MTPTQARDRVLKAVPDADEYYNEEHDVWLIVRKTEPGIIGRGNSADEAWISAANSDRVNQFHKEA